MERKKLGRPRKYDELTRTFVLAMPTSMQEKIKADAEEKNLNVSEYMIGLVISADPQIAGNMMSYLNETNKVLKEIREENKQLKSMNTTREKQLDSLLKKNLNIKENIFTPISEIKEIDEFLLSHDLNKSDEEIYKDFQTHMWEKGMEIVRPKEIKKYITRKNDKKTMCCYEGN